MDAALTTTPERPVFVATDDRRARRLRYLAAVAVALAGAWVLALAIGMLSIGRLPGLALPVIAHGADKAPPVDAFVPMEASPSVAVPSQARATPAAAAPTARAALSQPRPAAVAARAATARKTPHPTKPKVTSPGRARTAPAPTVPPAATATITRQGWARRGLAAPPGRAQPTKPKTRTAEPPGHTRQHATTDPTTAPATPVATPVPPGQQKKADDPKQQG